MCVQLHLFQKNYDKYTGTFDSKNCKYINSFFINENNELLEDYDINNLENTKLSTQEIKDTLTQQYYNKFYYKNYNDTIYFV